MSGLQGQVAWDGTGKSEKDQLLELYGAVNAIMSAVQTLERTINVTVKDQFDDIGTKLDSLVKAVGKAPSSGGGGNPPGGSGAGASGSGATNKLGGQIKLAKPDKFDGSDRNKAVNFRIACTHYLKIVHQGASEEERVAFIISYLEGVAHEWLQPYLEEDLFGNNPGQVTWLHNSTLFWDEFNKRWGVINRTENYRLKLRNLTQKKSVQDYLKDFQTYSAALAYGDEALRDMFYDGLKREIKDMMLSQNFDPTGNNTTFQNVSDKALEIDARLMAYNRETTGQKSTTKKETETLRSQGNREKFSVGDHVYMMGTDGKAKKGKISAINKNAKGVTMPTVIWDGTTGGVQLPFRSISKDSRPNNDFKPSKKDNKGPAPMDLDNAGKGKGKIICNRCGGKGHIAKECPSTPMSGHEINSDEGSDDDESVKDDA
jgi:hypothetical protein